MHRLKVIVIALSNTIESESNSNNARWHCNRVLELKASPSIDINVKYQKVKIKNNDLFYKKWYEIGGLNQGKIAL